MRYPIQYWKHPGALVGTGLVHNIQTDRFLGVLSALIQAAFSFQGMELVAMCVLQRSLCGTEI